jgi:hypothetical protein
VMEAHECPPRLTDAERALWAYAEGPDATLGQLYGIAECRAALRDLSATREAIRKHHAQHADDLCWMDDNELYAAAGLPPREPTVGDPEAMLANCRRYIAQRCKPGGGWKSYAELEAELAAAKAEIERLRKHVEPAAGPYLVVPIPLNEDGAGPEMDESRVVKTEWEVWDACCQTVSIHETEGEALAAKARLEGVV